jgi:hypothetical protein
VKIISIEIRTFDAAAALASGAPTNTEQAQYSLVWPIACQLGLGRQGVTEALGDVDNPAANRLLSLVGVVVDPDFTAEPAAELNSGKNRRRRRVVVGNHRALGRGRRPASGTAHPGEGGHLLGPAPTWPVVDPAELVTVPDASATGRIPQSASSPPTVLRAPRRPRTG